MAEEEKKVKVQFAAIDPIIQRNIVSPIETKMRGKDSVSWGDQNKYPDYLWELYNNCATLRAIIDGYVNYILGDKVALSGVEDKIINRKGETITDVIKQIATHYMIYGGFALQVIRTKVMNGIAEIYAIDPRYLRTNDEGDVFYYSEEWSRAYVQDKHLKIYPTYMPESMDASQASSIIAYKSVYGQVYPAPVYAASVMACETERSIAEYHLNEIHNGFQGTTLIGFNNGIPSDEEAKENERNINRKYAGAENAGRVIITYSLSKENAPTVEQLSAIDFGAKYESLAKNSRQQIFTAFRANPNLFGIPTESLGFSSEEYDSAFRLFNRTQIQPIQKAIIDVFDKIYQQKGIVEITPFTLDAKKGVVE